MMRQGCRSARWLFAARDGGPAELHNHSLHWTGATTVLVIRTLVVGPGQ